MGEGRFGPVYRASDPDSHPDVIIRVFEVVRKRESGAPLLRALEALCETSLDHPSIARPIAAGELNGVPYLVHIRLPGVPADQRLRESGPQSLASLVLPVTRFAAAIDFAAAAGVSHGALTLADLILNDERSGVSGFGLVEALVQAGVLTQPPDPQDDVRRLGALTLELVLGTPCDPARVRSELSTLARARGRALADIFEPLLNSGAEAEGMTALAFAAAVQDAAGDAATLPVAPAALQAPAPSVPVVHIEPERLTPHPVQVDAEIRPAPAPDLDVEFRDRPAEPWVPRLALDNYSVEQKTSHTARWATAAAAVGAAAALAVVVIGFTGGFTTGGDDTASSPPAATDSTTARAVPDDGGAPTDSRDFTESVVSEPVPQPVVEPAPEPAQSQLEASSEPGAGARSVPARPTSGGLLVHSDPSGARVTVDGELRGVTPAVIRGLDFGNHSVEVIGSGRAPWRTQVALTPERPSRALEATLADAGSFARGSSSAPQAVPTAGISSGALRISSSPSQAQVFVDGALVGRTPMLMSGVNPGVREVRIESPGYQAWTGSVTVTAGERSSVAASLRQ
jgi:hypothetical protein